MNRKGFAVQLHCRGEQINSGGDVFAAVRSPLQGDLTISGITNIDGSPANWVLPAGTAAGVYAAPGSGHSGGAAVWYQLSDPTDADKVIAVVLPK